MENIDSKIKSDITFLLTLQKHKDEKTPNGGWDINLFKSSFVNKIKALSRMGQQKSINAILNYFETTNKNLGLYPVFTSNHGIWKYRYFVPLKTEEKLDNEFNDGEVVFHSTSKGGKSFFIVKYRDEFKDYDYESNNSMGSVPSLNELKSVVNSQIEYAPKVLIDKLKITSDKNLNEEYRDNKLAEEKENKIYSNEIELIENFKGNSISDFNLHKEFEGLYEDIIKLFNSPVASAKKFFFDNGLKEISDNFSKQKSIKSKRKAFIVFLEKGKDIMTKYLNQADQYAIGLIGENLFEYLNKKYNLIFSSSPEQKELWEMPFNEFLSKVQLSDNSSFGEKEVLVSVIGNDYVEEVSRIKNSNNEDVDDEFNKLQLEKFHQQEVLTALRNGKPVPVEVVNFYSTPQSVLFKNYGSTTIGREFPNYSLASNIIKDIIPVKEEEVIEDKAIMIHQIQSALTNSNFWLHPESREAKIINKAEKDGWVIRLSHTQAQWSVKAEKELLNRVTTKSRQDIEQFQLKYLKKLDESDYRFHNNYSRLDECKEIIRINNLLTTSDKIEVVELFKNYEYFFKVNDSILIDWRLTKFKDEYDLYELKTDIYTVYESRLNDFINEQTTPEKPQPKIEEEIINPNTDDEFYDAIFSQIEPHDGWYGNEIKERYIKRQIAQLVRSGRDETPTEEVEAIFEVYKKRFIQKYSIDNRSSFIYYTTAPVSYDGFGTSTIESTDWYAGDKQFRKVSIPVKAKEWQLNRYSSGGNVAFYTEEDFNKFKNDLFKQKSKHEPIFKEGQTVFYEEGGYKWLGKVKNYKSFDGEIIYNVNAFSKNVKGEVLNHPSETNPIHEEDLKSDESEDNDIKLMKLADEYIKQLEGRDKFITPEQIAIVQPEWDKMQDFLNDKPVEPSKQIISKVDLSLPKTAYNFVFDRITKKIAPNLLALLESAEYVSDVYGKSNQSEDSGYMPFVIEGLDKDSHGRYILSFAHYYVQNGDLMCDPSMEVRLDVKQGTIEALSFKQDGIFDNSVKDVYVEKDGKLLVNTSQKNNQNSFLNKWTNNLVQQKHVVNFKELPTPTIEEDEEEIIVSNEPVKQIVSGVEMLLPLTDENNLSRQLIKLTGDSFNDVDFTDDLGSSASPCKILVHKKTGRRFLVPCPEQVFKGISAPYENQFKLNKAIEEYLDSKDEFYIFSDEEKAFLYLYEGYGGLEKEGATGRGLLWEYYTPQLLIKKMWGLANKYGFNNGKVLEPSVGVGRFLDYVENTPVTTYEINPYSARICKILHPTSIVNLKSFEEHFYMGNMFNPKFEKDFSLVIGNPPYGDFVGKRSVAESKRLKVGVKKFEHYFILRGLDCLKSGGLLIYVSTANLFTKGYDPIKEKISEHAELIDAYLLPNKTFSKTQINTSIIVLKKR